MSLFIEVPYFSFSFAQTSCSCVQLRFSVTIQFPTAQFFRLLFIKLITQAHGILPYRLRTVFLCHLSCLQYNRQRRFRPFLFKLFPIKMLQIASNCQTVILECNNGHQKQDTLQRRPQMFDKVFNFLNNLNFKFQ